MMKKNNELIKKSKNDLEYVITKLKEEGIFEEEKSPQSINYEILFYDFFVQKKMKTSKKKKLKKSTWICTKKIV